MPYSGAGPATTPRPERGGQLLGAEAHAEHRQPGLDRGAEQHALGFEPGQVVVHAHRTAHHHEPRHRGDGIRRRDRVAVVDAHHVSEAPASRTAAAIEPGPS